MLDHLKRKRMLIEQSVSGRKNDREGMSSVERRKMVEKDLSKYNEMVNKTMQDWRKMREQAQRTQEIVGKTLDQREFREFSAERVEERQIMTTPSVKDISPSDPGESALANEFYELSLDQKSQNAIFSPNKNISSFYKKQPQAIPALIQKEEQNIINNIEEQSSRRESQPQIEDEQIKMPKIVNQSVKTESNNNSEAIFFTSHFKEMMNNQLNSPQKSPPKQEQKVPPLAQLQQNRLQEAEKQVTGRFQRGLHNNPSGQSLAISNDSSLKYSLNQSAIQDIIARKLSNELVVESLSPTQKGFCNMAEGLLLRQDVKDFIQFAKTYTLAMIHAKNMKKSVFLELQINQQLKFEAKVRQTKIHNLRSQKKDSLLAKCFLEWSSLTQTKKQRFQGFLSSASLSIKQKCFKVLKMVLFDRRINHQIDMYFLSKMFQAFKNATDSQFKKSNQKAYKFYFKHLKKRMFHSFVEGCYNSRRQTLSNETAINHQYYSTLSRYFTAWRETAPKEERFVRLAVTTTNLMKQTSDHRLLHTRTFDFYEIK